MLKQILSWFGSISESEAAVPLTPEDHRLLDDAAWRLVDALRACDPTVSCEVRNAGDRRVVPITPPNPDLHGLRLVVDREEVRVDLGDHVHWRRRRGDDPEADARDAVASLIPLIEGRGFVAERRLDGHVVERGMGCLETGVTGLWPETMTRDRLGGRDLVDGELTTRLHGWRGPVPAEVAARLRNRPPSESQARLADLMAGGLEPEA